jgi:hypothetical protein
VRSRLLLTLSLLVAATGLALFLILGGNKKPEQTDLQLTSIAPNTINKIRIIRNGQDDIHFEKQAGRWMMQSPYQFRASDLRINTMLKLLGAHSYAQFNSKDIQLSRFMLDKPQVSIEFNGARIDFGDTSPLEDRRYVRYHDMVHIINDVLFQQLQAPAYYFLNTRLLPEDAAITAILLPGHAIRTHQGVWTVDPADHFKADTIVELANAWRNADAIFISKNEDTAQHESVRIEMDKNNPIEFSIVHELPQLVLARPDLGIQYHLGDYDARRMLLHPEGPPSGTNTEHPVK